MVDAFEILRLRRKEGRTPTYLQICWCAATKKNFVGRDDVYKVTPQEVESVNIIQLCSDIKNVLFNLGSRVRFNLTLGSQLTYGSLRIFDYQTFSLEEMSEKTFTSMMIGNGNSQKGGAKKENPKKRRSHDDGQSSFTIEDFSDVDVHELFRDDEERKDEHIIEEVDEFFKPELHASFRISQASSDVEKVMQELYEEMQRTGRRSRRTTPEDPEAIHSEILRQTVTRTPQRLSPRSVSASESAKTAVTPPSPQRRGSQLQTPAPERVPASQTGHRFDTPTIDYIDSELLPEAAMPDEPPSSQSSIVASTALVAPPLPEISDTCGSGAAMDTQVPEENFPTIQEGVEEATVDAKIGRYELRKNLKIDKIRQIEITMAKDDVHTRKTKVIEVIRKAVKKKVPVQTLFTLPATSCAIGLRRSKTALNDQFINSLLLRERLLKTPKATGHAVAEEANRVEEEEEEIVPSPPKIMKAKETTIQPDSSQVVEDNICEDAGVTNRPRKTSNSFSEYTGREEPKSKKLKVQEADVDGQSVTAMSKAGIFGRIKSLWRSMQIISKGRKGKGKKVKVDFREIVHPDRCNVTDAISSLMHCFELEKDGKISIEQKKPYGPLYLVKPSA